MRPATRVLLALVVALLLAGSAGASGRESYISLTAADRAGLERLTRLVSIDRVDRLEVRAYATESQLAGLAAAGYSWKVLPLPGEGEAPRTGLAARAKAGQWDAYPTYVEYVAMMQGFAAEHPAICRLVDIGPTANQVRPHRLLAVKISDNPDLEEGEPEVFYTSSMHGDETVGYVLMLHLIDELLTHYDPTSSDPYDRQVTELVEGMEIWINPLANPDGTYFAGDTTLSGAIRYFTNADGTNSGVDPNRNFPDPVLGDHPDGNAWWPETVAMMSFADQHPFVLSANFHGGAEVVNYPWDSSPRLHADNDWFVTLARAYADRVHQDAAAPPYYDTGYMRDLDDGITNGFAWYTVYGGRQDFTTYWHAGRETTIELSTTKKPNASTLPRYWDYNRRALLDYLATALTGVRGLVTDQDGSPLEATVTVLLHDVPEDRSWVFTDPEAGDFHRLLLPGRYLLLVEADGFQPYAAAATVLPGAAARVELTLAADRGLSVTVHGTVRSGASGPPVAGATVELLTAPGGSTTTAEDGTWVLADLPEGACVVRVTGSGYGAEVAAAQVSAPEATLDVEVRHLLEAPPVSAQPKVRTEERP